MTIKIIVTKMNYTAMPKIIEFIAKNFPLIKNISINGLDVRARAKTFKDMVAVSFTDYIPYAQKAIDIAKKYNINIVLYSIPLCVLDEKYRIYCGEQPDLVSLYKTPTIEVQNKTEDHGYVKECYSCKINKNCYGTWFSYYDVYGTSELKPVKEKEKRNIVFKICGSCNNDCLFCGEYGSQPKKDESLTNLKKKIDSLKIKEEECVILAGGEPTLNKDIFILINHIKKYTLNIHISTNGRKLKNMSFLKKLTDSGISEFCVDLYAPFSKRHEDITRKKNSFSETIKGLENLKKSDCKITIKIVITKLNYKYLHQIVKYINEKFSNKTKIIFSNLSLNENAIIDEQLTEAEPMGVNIDKKSHFAAGDGVLNLLRNKKIISVKGSLVAPYLDDSINYCIKEKIPFQIDMFPICI
ncbi:MAG: radical SAM protein, partial [Candidatus Aenigmarchaeota archaeon]|nr:radical SAM protein [Candidatus Aenigmarchaeota archaeon]